MYVLGGPGLRGFTFALLVGVLVGTYSSIGIAAPILLLGGNKEGSLKS
jgi:preprotein translocase subunit SecF